MICTHTPVPNIITKACMVCMLYKNWWDQGRAVIFHQPENKMSCAQRKKFSAIGLFRKVLGLGVLGLKYHVLGSKMVVSDQSN